jgi:hypothetical protein
MKKDANERERLLSLLPREPEMICTPRFIASGETIPCMKEKCMAFRYWWNETNKKHECYEGTNSIIPDPTHGRTYECLLVKPTEVSARASSRSSIF